MGNRTRAPQTTQAPTAPGVTDAAGTTDFGDNSAQQDALRGAADVPIDHPEPGAFRLSGGAPVPSGNVTVGAGAEDPANVLVQAGRIDFRASVALAPHRTIAPSDQLRFGPTQTLLGSDRVGVYRHPNGQEYRSHSTQPQLRDASYSERVGNDFLVTEAPFYWRPQTLSATNPTAAITDAYDQPSAELPKHEGDATLVRVEGSDRFVTGWAVTKGAERADLASYSWSVPWTTDVAPDFTGTGGVDTVAPSATAPPTLDGTAVLNHDTTDFHEYRSLEAANAMDTGTLVGQLAQLRANSPTSYEFAVQALRARNPQFVATIHVVDTAEWFGADEIVVTATGARPAQSGPQSLNNGQRGDFTFRLSDVLTLEQCTEGATIRLSAADTGTITNDPGTQTWSFPFAPASEIDMHAPNGTSYKVSVRWI